MLLLKATSFIVCKTVGVFSWNCSRIASESPTHKVRTPLVPPWTPVSLREYLRQENPSLTLYFKRAPDLLFYCSHLLEYIKVQTILQSSSFYFLIGVTFLTDFGVDELVEFRNATKCPWLLSNVIDNMTGRQLANGEVKRIIEWFGRKVGSALVKSCNRTAKERRLQTLCDKCDNSFVLCFKQMFL